MKLQVEVNLQVEACNFIKKETLAQVLTYKSCEIFKNTFFTEHIWVTTSEGRHNPDSSFISSYTFKSTVLQT